MPKPILSEIPIAAKVKARREYLRLTQQEVSDELSVERATYARWENAVIAIKASEMNRLADILNVPVSYFYEEDQPAADTEPFSDYTYEVTDRERDDLTSSIAGVPPEIRPAALAAFKALAKSLAASKEPKTFGAGKGARTVVDPDIDGVMESKEEETT